MFVMITLKMLTPSSHDKRNVCGIAVPTVRCFCPNTCFSVYTMHYCAPTALLAFRRERMGEDRSENENDDDDDDDDGMWKEEQSLSTKVR